VQEELVLEKDIPERSVKVLHLEGWIRGAADRTGGFTLCAISNSTHADQIDGKRMIMP
jgi:hypothetical protein